MTIDIQEIEIDIDTKLSFNGISATTGGYLFEPMSSRELAEVAQGKTLEPNDPHLKELQARNASKDSAHFGVKEGIDPTKLEQAGWAVIFPAAKPGSPEAAQQAAIREALSPLLQLRRAQASRLVEHRYKEFSGSDGYRPGETKQKFLARLGVGPGPADPDKLPYYLLLVGSPEQIPFHVQYQIDVQYAVGRLDFDTLEEYDNYARSVVAAETGGLVLPRELALLGVANPDDMATQLSRKHLVAPLADIAEVWTQGELPGWSVTRHFDEQATKSRVSELLGGRKTPALLFTASHGMGFDQGDPLQQRRQGALLCQDWTGPKQWSKPIDESLYFSGDDLRSDAGMLGMISFNFACYGGGTPQYDEFSKQAFKQRKTIADTSFTSGLHRKMLGHPKGGALAAIGHVERAWGYSFMWGTGKAGAAERQLAVFESTLRSLMSGAPVGLALEYFNERYAEISSDLSQQIEALEWDPDAVDPYTLANMWTSNNDARGYAILGDPAVRLSLDSGAEGRKLGRDAIELTSVARVDAPASAPASETPATAASDQAQAIEAVNFGLFGRKPEAEGSAEGEPVAPQPGRIDGFVNKIVDTLGRAVEDAMTLEIRTYVSSNPGAAARASKDELEFGGDLRAYTRLAIDGDTVVIVPERDGVIEAELWKLHLELVKQAQQTRSETIAAVLSMLSGVFKR
jgi:hypothetical protein